MDCFILGSGGMMPMPRRRLTSVALRTEGRVYLFDCGEGTQLPYKELHLGQRPLRLIAISHLHADHCLGLPGMLMLRAQMPNPDPLDILGPPGLDSFVRHVRQDLALYINYEIRIHQWSKQADIVAYRDDLVRVLWRPLDHSVLCLGFRIEEHDRPGRFDPEEAASLGVPQGPLWSQLQQGRSVQCSGGATIQPEQVLGPPRRGCHVAYVTDTAPTSTIADLLKDTDLALVEGMFLAQHASEARDKKHLTAQQAGQIARHAGARRLVLVHLSPRYEDKERPRFEEEVRLHHDHTLLAQDGMQLEVSVLGDGDDDDHVAG